VRLYDIPTTLKDDAMTLVCGELLGTGAARQVYVCAFDPTWVVKLDTSRGKFQNVREWAVWQNFKESAADKKWLAPVGCISDSGHWLMQRRTTPVSLIELRRLAPRVPKYFTDLKSANWGLLDGVVVCHDYGMSLHEVASGTKKAEWWRAADEVQS
jgi:hypothetical protein